MSSFKAILLKEKKKNIFTVKYFPLYHPIAYMNVLNSNGRMCDANTQSKPQSLPYPSLCEKTMHLCV